jgi:RNA polymerase sigma-70 factor (ECF subfamily)
MDPTDKSLMDAHCQGDPTAFATVLRRHGPRVFAALVRLTGDRSMAEDLLQETFARAHEKARTLRTEHVRAWLMRIATHLAMDGFRRQRRLRVVSLSATCGDGENCPDFSATVADPRASEPSASLELEEKRKRVRRAIDALPPKQRATLMLSYYQQLSYAEVAETLGCSAGTVKTQMFRAIKSLAQLLPSPTGGEL